ncbi:helix-turn-helix domain-containing protein [Brevibacillus thermoruber]|uniref:Helix-turn-helix domain-containing protein n=1 Tax=Brevibacillus thermoruber TaxID=33942 RepID=A0A9X3TV36_9BACL|nr:helix-turn-helix domain-containing protein [Brevibacillus thermoruber]MDA5111090.1 helix-turn-helix domain-containing protein [Brevibacillus thermoruber]
MMGFKDRLKELRTRKGITQEVLALDLGIPESTVRRYESSDENTPRRERLEKIADYFGVSVDYLLGRTDDPSPSEMINRNLSEIENLFFYELDKLSEEDKKKALEHVRYLRYLAEQKNKNKK